MANGCERVKPREARNAGYSAEILNASERKRTSLRRREWDSNPRYGFPHTRFPSVRLKPLGHPSVARGHITLVARARHPRAHLRLSRQQEPLSPGGAITYISRT